MKKFLTTLLLLSLLTILLRDAEQNKDPLPTNKPKTRRIKTTIKVGATPVPHAQILNVVKPSSKKRELL